MTTSDDSAYRALNRRQFLGRLGVSIAASAVIPALSACDGGGSTAAPDDDDPAVPPVPKADRWRERLVAQLPPLNTILAQVTQATYNANNHFNHDGVLGAVMGQILVGDRPEILAYRDHQRRVYGDYYAMVPRTFDGITAPGFVAGYYLFPEGASLDWRHNRHQPSLDLLAALRARGAYVNFSSPLVNQSASRECISALLTHVEGNRCGIPWNRDRVNLLANWALGHVDQWVTEDWKSYDPNSVAGLFQPFMAGLTMVGLAKYAEHLESSGETDARVLPAIVALCDYLWQYFDPVTGKIPLNIRSDGVRGGDYSLLNLMIAPGFAWAWRQTREAKLQIRGDEIFAAGVETNEFWMPKQWNEAFRHSGLYLLWRSDQKTVSVP